MKTDTILTVPGARFRWAMATLADDAIYPTTVERSGEVYQLAFKDAVDLADARVALAPVLGYRPGNRSLLDRINRVTSLAMIGAGWVAAGAVAAVDQSPIALVGAGIAAVAPGLRWLILHSRRAERNRAAVARFAAATVRRDQVKDILLEVAFSALFLLGAVVALRRGGVL